MRMIRWIVGAGVVVLHAGGENRVATAQAPERLFVATDVFAGGVPRPDPVEGEANSGDFVPLSGWQVGASVRFLPDLRWLEVVGTYGQHSNPVVRVRDALAGVRLTSPWVSSGAFGVRGFTHTLAGYAWSQGFAAGDSSDSSPEFVLGAGFDSLVFLRIQVDYVRTRLARVPRNSARGFIGAVVPFCWRGCRPEWADGIDLSGGR